MSKVRNVALAIFGLFILSIWSNAVYRVAEKKGKPGFITSAIEKFSTFPREAKNYWNKREYLTISQTYVDPDLALKEINNLDEDLFILNSYWDESRTEWVTTLSNLKDGTLVYEWSCDPSILENEKYTHLFRDERPMHSWVNPDTSVILNFTETETLVKLDKESKVVWKNNELGFHHSMMQDSSGNMWICAAQYGQNNRVSGGNHSSLINLNGGEIPYRDDIICKVDISTGQILFQKSVSEILIENELEGILFNSLDYRGDPIHLNDIEPALKTTKFWDEGDLFISLRSLAAVLLYSPEDNRVKKIIRGPFLAQHDVDIISDSSIAVFDNRVNKTYQYITRTNRELRPMEQLKSNRIVAYDLSSDTFAYPYLEFFESEQIDTQSEGLFDYLSGNRVFVEEQNSGKIYVFSHSDVLLRKQFPVEGREKVHITNWIRTFESNPLR